jgi:hypothetical protein
MLGRILEEKEPLYTMIRECKRQQQLWKSVWRFLVACVSLSSVSITSSEFIIYSGKEGSRATILGRHDIVVTRNRGTCNCYSLHINIFGKETVLHFALTPFCSWGLCQSQSTDIAVLMSSYHRLLIFHSPHLSIFYFLHAPNEA